MNKPNKEIVGNTTQPAISFDLDAFLKEQKTTLTAIVREFLKPEGDIFAESSNTKESKLFSQIRKSNGNLNLTLEEYIKLYKLFDPKEEKDVEGIIKVIFLAAKFDTCLKLKTQREAFYKAAIPEEMQVRLTEKLEKELIQNRTDYSIISGKKEPKINR